MPLHKCFGFLQIVHKWLKINMLANSIKYPKIWHIACSNQELNLFHFPSKGKDN